MKRKIERFPLDEKQRSIFTYIPEDKVRLLDSEAKVKAELKQRKLEQQEKEALRQEREARRKEWNIQNAFEIQRIQANAKIIHQDYPIISSKGHKKEPTT